MMTNDWGGPIWLDDGVLERVIRVDLGMEGKWSETVVCIWSPADGNRGVPESLATPSPFRPCLELYFDGGWIGVHTFTLVGGAYVLDGDRVRRIVERVMEVQAE